MLPKYHRLRTDKDIQAVFKKGRRIMTPLLRFQVLRTGRPTTRLAVVVAVKVAKRATARNLIKRRVREILRTSMDDIPTGYDVVVQARSACVTYAQEKVKGQKTPHEIAASYEALEQNIAEFISKLRAMSS